MKNIIQSNRTLTVVALGLLMAAVAEAKVSEQTLKNLNAAFQGESNATDRYTKFAEQAAVEGYPQVARLFRAGASAESIHRDVHKRAILSLGGTIDTFQLEAVRPGTTAENLQAAIKGESDERDAIYPEFLAQAKADDSRAAIRTFEFASAGEKEHAALYEDALRYLGKQVRVDYYVCQTCGATLTTLPARKCPACRKGRDEFEKIN